MKIRFALFIAVLFFAMAAAAQTTIKNPTLDSNPTQPMQAATKQYVDNKPTAVWATTDIQTAINSLPAAGGWVQLLPNKTYTITCASNQINTGTKVVEILGAGETSVIAGSGCALVTLASSGSKIKNLSVNQTVANASTVGVFVGTGTTTEVTRWVIEDVFFNSLNKFQGSAIKTQFGLEGYIIGGETRGWGCGVELTGYDTEHRSNANHLIAAKLRWGVKGLCIAANAVDNVFLTGHTIEGNSGSGIYAESGAIYASQGHIEQNGSGTAPQVDLLGDAHIVSMGNLYAYAPPVPNMDIRTAASNSQPQSSLYDKFNGGITHNNTTLPFTVNDPLIDFSTAGAGTVLIRRGADTSASNANFAQVFRGFPWYDFRGPILNTTANTHIAAYAGRTIKLGDYTGSVFSQECYPNGDNSCYFWGKITAIGGLTLGSSSTNLTRYAKYTATLSPAQVAANTCAAQSATVTGILAADVIIGFTKPTEQAGLSFVGARATADNTVSLQFCNNTASPITPTASQTYTFVVVQ